MRRAAIVVALWAAGCAAAEPVAPRYPTSIQRRETARALADAARALEPDAPRTLHVTATFGHERGRLLQGRGVVAVRPPRDVRLQLLGPGGLTALDLWISGEHDRLAIPALGRVERDLAERPGRPAGFLRWWLLAPLTGRLLWIDADGRAVLRAADGAIVTVELAARSVKATRTTRADVEHVDAELSPCGRSTWRSERTGVTVSIACERATGPAPDRAFEEPR